MSGIEENSSAPIVIIIIIIFKWVTATAMPCYATQVSLNPYLLLLQIQHSSSSSSSSSPSPRTWWWWWCCWPQNKKPRSISTSKTISSPHLPRLSLNGKSPIVSCGGDEAVSSSLLASQLEREVRVVGLVGEGSISPLKGAPWEEVMLHTAKRLKWIDESFEMRVFNDGLLGSSDDPMVKNLQREISNVDILMIVAVNNSDSVEWILKNCGANVPNIICFDSSPSLKNKLGGSVVGTDSRGSLFSKVTGILQKNNDNATDEVVQTVSEAWDRRNSDDIRFCLLVIINAYIRPVSSLKNLRSKGFKTLNCMVKNCGSQILNCLLDPNCRKALQCLNRCSPVDQVCNYRCIASYESPSLEAFSLCVLQKHNCLELDAKILDKPYVPPMFKFRGNDLDHETAEDLFVGWLGRLDWSWRVVAGQNPAYDQFPCQYQLFYRGKARGSFWYEPVFQVMTLEGKLVWRRRRYRVKRGRIPGTFNFSVLDNGVVSKEFWTIVDVADDLGWGLFHYSGAAEVAGQSYTGAVLVSPDGEYPNEKEKLRLVIALEKCGIKEWELYKVDNCSCQDPPLGIPEGSSLHGSSVEIKELK